MKKFLVIFALLLISIDGYAGSCYHVYRSKKYKDCIVYFTQPQENRGSEYTIFVVKNSTKQEGKINPIYVMSFHSTYDNDSMFIEATNCFDNIDKFIKTHNFENCRTNNIAIRTGDKNVWFESNAQPLTYTDFR